MGIWPFSNKTESLEEAKFFQGITDWHSHILPGVDDGFKNIEDSLKALHIMESLGVKNLWLTPHIMEDYPNETADLRKRYEELKLAYEGSINLFLASENMLDVLFEERLEKKDFLPLGENGNHLLVETSYYNPPMNMKPLLEKVKSLGYYPVLAHPERYQYMSEKDYEELKEMGILFQANFFSILGAYGNTARKKLEWMLKKGMIDIMGSDLHRHTVLEALKGKNPQNKKAFDLLKEVGRRGHRL